jgi:hypothetical protein
MFLSFKDMGNCSKLGFAQLKPELKVFVSLTIFNQNPVNTSPLPHACHMYSYILKYSKTVLTGRYDPKICLARILARILNIMMKQNVS